MNATRVRDYWDDESPMINREVLSDSRDTWTGLYDQHGSPLHREPNRIGFDPHRYDKPKRARKKQR